MNYTIENIDLAFLKNYLRLEPDFTEDDMELNIFLAVAKEHLRAVCGFTAEELNTNITLIPALLLLLSEMYTNRQAEIPSNSKANPIIERYISINRRYFL